jgi:aryl-alcohol dehydrogenase-like predicted oxidoreductase
MTDNRIVLGTAKLGLEGRESAFDMLDAYVELGGRHIDTAHIYSDWIPGERGRSETVLGEWLRARGNRDQLVITTKGAHPPRDNITAGRSDRASIRKDCEESLTRLGVEQVDLYYLHRDEPSRPVAEMIETLQELQREGKIKAFGGSNWQPARIAGGKVQREPDPRQCLHLADEPGFRPDAGGARCGGAAAGEGAWAAARSLHLAGRGLSGEAFAAGGAAAQLR